MITVPNSCGELTLFLHDFPIVVLLRSVPGIKKLLKSLVGGRRFTHHLCYKNFSTYFGSCSSQYTIIEIISNRIVRVISIKTERGIEIAFSEKMILFGFDESLLA